jgi:hypothetical protein
MSIYLVKSCTKIVDGKLVGLCGYCCHMLNFKEFPNEKWLGPKCRYLNEGLCTCYDERPLACSGSPFFDQEVEIYPPNKFCIPWCSYRRLVCDFYKIPYQILDSAEECIEQYRKIGLGDFERWTVKFFKKRTVFYERS